MAHFAMGQNGALGFAHRFAVARVDQPTRRIAADIFKILAGEHGQNAGHPRRRRNANRFDARMRHGGAYEHRISLPMHVDVMGVIARPGQVADVFGAFGFRANSEILSHLDPLPYSAATAATSCPEAAITALTML